LIKLLHHTADIGTALEPVDVNTTLLLALAFGVAPLFLGLANSRLSFGVGNSAKIFIIGTAFGITILSIWDLFQGASGLGLNLGPEAISIQLLLLLAVSVGFLVPFAIAGPKFRSINSSQIQINPYALAYVFAMIIGFHAFAEGIIIGFDLQSGYAFTFTQRTVQALSFVLHKIAEGIVISIPIMLTRPRSDAFVLAGIIGSMPLLVGIALAYIGLPGSLASYAFALATGGSAYILLRFGYTLYTMQGSKMPLFAGVIVGLLFMYFAGWIHTIEI
jgi:zinc transporter ZupT